jgi:hypothetical protein
MLVFASSHALALNYGLGSGWVDTNHAPLFSAVRARLIHDGYRPAKLQHDYRDLCVDKDWSHVCARFPETLDCRGASADGECDFVYEKPRSATDPDGSYRLVDTMVGPRGRVVIHEQPADSDDLNKVHARMDLKLRGCGDEYILDIRVCDLSWRFSTKASPSDLPALLTDGSRSTDPEHGPLYIRFRAKLVRRGYRPARLPHDDQDQCTDKDWSHVCKRFPEALDCDWTSRDSECDFVFERPPTEWEAHGPYLVIQTAETPRGRVAFHEGSPDTDDLKRIWARKDLKRRGCEDERLLETRYCDWTSDQSESKTRPSASAPHMPDLPPLSPDVTQPTSTSHFRPPTGRLAPALTAIQEGR